MTGNGNNCERRLEDGVEVVSLSGEVDLSWSSEVRREILDALDDDHPVLVELSGVSYIDSSGIAALVEGYQVARSRDLRFGLVAISDAVKAVLELARLDQVFPIYADLTAARAG
ncbi:MAG: STAS domain-containing protein [Xanthomonadales bacterium]|nr:STAS domain-containing protein [Xanthomonadales bacterium]